MNQTPFIVQDADVALWTTDGAGNLATRLFVGGQAESVQMEQQFKERTLYYPGVPTGTVFQEEEEFTVEVKNVWLHQRTATGPQMPTVFTRNVSMLLVIAWSDPITGAWCNRTYVGVKGKGRTIEGADTYQTIRYTAETMYETAGLGTALVVPLTYGDIRYVSQGCIQVLYGYSFYDGTVTAVDAGRLAATATLDLSVPGHMALRFGSAAPVMTATPAGVNVRQIVAVGSSFVDADPRVEFWSGPVRVASISSTGILAVPEIQESTSQPPGGMVIGQNAQWFFSLLAVAAAASFNETL